MKITYTAVNAVSIADEELAVALADMDADAKQAAGIIGMTPADILNLLRDVIKGQELIQNLGMTGSYYIKQGANGKTYVIIRGHASLRPYLKGTKYLSTNPKIARVGIGPIAGPATIPKNVVISTTIYATENIIQFIYDDTYTLEFLTADILYDGTVAAMSVYASQLVTTALITGAFGVFSMALPAVGIGLVVGVAVGYLASSLNEEYQITSTIATALRSTANAFKDQFIGGEEVVENAHVHYNPDETQPARPPEYPEWEPPEYDDYPFDKDYWFEEEVEFEYELYQGPSEEELQKGGSGGSN